MRVVLEIWLVKVISSSQQPLPVFLVSHSCQSKVTELGAANPASTAASLPVKNSSLAVIGLL